MALNHTEKSASKDKASNYQPKKLLIMNILIFYGNTPTPTTE